MSEPLLPEIMSFNFPPNGQLLPINQNQALFSLLGTTFGGNGQTTFALPNAHPCWQRPHTRRGGRRAEPNTLDLRDADADARRCTEAPSARPAVASRADRDERHAGPVEPGDEDFLYRVYARGGASPGKLGRDAKGSLPSDAGRRPAPILPGHYSDAAFQVILVDGEPAGRLYVARWGDEIRIVDIAETTLSLRSFFLTRMHTRIYFKCGCRRLVRLGREQRGPYPYSRGRAWRGRGGAAGPGGFRDRRLRRPKGTAGGSGRCYREGTYLIRRLYDTR
jgi:hypothetical protein